MSFEKAGRYTVTIKDAYCAEPSKFEDTPPDAINIAVEVQEIGGPGEGAWTGEVSGRYGVGNAAGKTQTEMTCQALMSTGADFGIPNLQEFIDSAHHVEDFEAIDAVLGRMIGAETTVSVEATKKGALIVRYLGSGGWKPKRLVKKATAGGAVGDAFA